MIGYVNKLSDSGLLLFFIVELLILFEVEFVGSVTQEVNFGFNSRLILGLEKHVITTLCCVISSNKGMFSRIARQGTGTPLFFFKSLLDFGKTHYSLFRGIT